VIVNLIVVPDKTKFSHVLVRKLENNTIVKIDAKTLDAFCFWMKLYGAQDGVEGILLEKRRKSLCGRKLDQSRAGSNRLSLFVTRPAR